MKRIITSYSMAKGALIESIADGSFATINHDNKRKIPAENKKIQRICKTVLLYKDGKSVEEIADLLNLNKRTIYYYLKTFNVDNHFMNKMPVTNVSDLQAFIEEISEDFIHSKISSYKEAQERIKQITGIHRGITQIREFLVKNYFYKNSKGFYVQNTKKINLIQVNERNKKCKFRKNDSLLDLKSEEIEYYIYSIADSYCYDINTIASRVKEKFELKESEKKIIAWMEINTSLF